MDAVASIGMDRQGILDEQQERDAYQFKPHLEELERMNQQIQGCFVFENRYTRYTTETLRVAFKKPFAVFLRFTAAFHYDNDADERWVNLSDKMVPW